MTNFDSNSTNSSVSNSINGINGSTRTPFSRNKAVSRPKAGMVPEGDVRIFADGIFMSNDSWKTGLNANDCIIGPSGSGKTRYYVKPNIMQCNESIIVTDTKGDLCEETRQLLEQNGYRVLFLNLQDMAAPGSAGYNPLAYIRRDARGRYDEQDILRIAHVLAPIEDPRQPFWDMAARQYLAMLIAYVLEALPDKEHSLGQVVELMGQMGREYGSHTALDELMLEWCRKNPGSFAARQYNMVVGGQRADRMVSSICGIMSEKLSTFVSDKALCLYRRRNQIRFEEIGRRKTAVFLTVSDTDRSMDKMACMFYAQAIQALCREADSRPDHRLKVPVRLILDDFATNAVIPDFDNIISVIRSRSIRTSIVLQSITQLDKMYQPSGARTIINNCDNLLYLGGQDPETVKFIAFRADLPDEEVMGMPIDRVCVLTRGQKGRISKHYPLTAHPAYYLLKEASQQPAADA
ncbi:MAG: type IV secretory system conjugative DNA transfer family protein [Eubacterium sp.]|nr:type IV secretory system conjugative DNA transfer family protein [Eubacterium sp.]